MAGPRRCDEAQAIKNRDTAQARAVRALPAAARIALTGTPVENQLSELWSIMDFTNPGLLELRPEVSASDSLSRSSGTEIPEAAEQLRRIAPSRSCCAA